ncbi:transposase [Pseudogracilibacillus sp. ICA-222130]|uniref:transposase n=1 Tax=Pseudogracilibacillus sp. ICA-222130 TaxID=3134655 RepID=UPI0030BAD9DF
MRSYDVEFKEFAIKLVLDEGKPRAEVARELDMPISTLSKWVKNYKKEQELKAEKLEYVTPSEHRKREKELLDRIKDLEEENAIIKKAARIFARKDQS